MDNFDFYGRAIRSDRHDRVAWTRQNTEERRDGMLRQGKAHERRDTETKQST